MTEKGKRMEHKKMISGDCVGCAMEQPCVRTYRRVSFGEKVYCPDGTMHLVDEASLA